MDGWNEIKSALESNRQTGAKLMRENVKHVAAWARLAMHKARWAPMRDESAAACTVSLTFVERDHRRDVGNIHGGAKYALDALTARHRYGAGAIYDDSQRWLPEVAYRIGYVGHGFKEPGILIEIETLEDRHEA